MRVPGTKIYRAFAELDRFSDEQCERFLAAAMRPTIRRVLRWVGCCVVGLVIAALCIGGMTLFDMNVARGQRIFEKALLVLVLVPTVAGVFAIALMRDVLLRRRMRHVINNRATCTGCGYKLLGLPVTSACMVACPECGAASEVDQALGELAVTADGLRTFRPEKQVKEPLVWNSRWTKSLLRGVKVSAYGVLLLALAVGGFVAWRFAAAESDAAVAKRMLDPRGAMQRYSASVQAKGVTAGDVDAAEVMDVATREYDGVCADLVRANAARVAAIVKAKPYLGFSVEFGYLGWDFNTTGVAREDMDQERSDFKFRKMLAEQAFERMRKSGLLDRIDGVAGLSRYERWLSPDGAALMNRFEAINLQHLMKLPKLQEARMLVAVNAGKRDEAIRAFDSGMVMAGMMRGGPTVVESLVAGEVEELMTSAVLPLLRVADAAQLKQLAEIVERAGRGVSIENVLEGSRVRYQQEVYRLFSDAAATRWGVLSMAGKQNTKMGVKQWWQAGSLGRLEDNLKEIDAAIEGAKAESRLRPVERSGERTSEGRAAGHYAVREMRAISAARATISRYDRVLLIRTGLSVLIALERYRRAHGQCPETLDELVPGWLAALPLDPWSDKPFVYRRQNEPDSTGFGFMLYSIGANRVNDGGLHRGWSAIHGRWNYDLPRIPEGDFVFGAAPTEDGTKLGR